MNSQKCVFIILVMSAYLCSTTNAGMYPYKESRAVKEQNKTLDKSGNDLLFHLLSEVYAIKSKIGNLEESRKALLKEVNALKNRRYTVCETGDVKLYNFPGHFYSWPQVKHVVFKNHFEGPPVITYGLFTIDTSNRENTRIRTDLSYITRSNFLIRLNT
ncbi:uncharacterized protein LOC134277727 [Saccostrea cucullata]|uniref:uncharacterized protein LOC134277727 n=1 Tax=Saccostrea cuccullata TaxID=36930 RepID=UPI002ED028FF